MCREIGASEARSKFSELLRGVMAGNRYAITLRGKAIAKLVPVVLVNRVDVALAVEQMRRFMRKCPSQQAVDLKSLINEGRS